MRKFHRDQSIRKLMNLRGFSQVQHKHLILKHNFPPPLPSSSSNVEKAEANFRMRQFLFEVTPDWLVDLYYLGYLGYNTPFRFNRLQQKTKVVLETTVISEILKNVKERQFFQDLASLLFAFIIGRFLVKVLCYVIGKIKNFTNNVMD